MHNSLKTAQQPVTNIKQKNRWKVWWRLLRPHTLTASFVPVLIGTALAIELEQIDISLFLAMLLACILIQGATNMFNEYYDYKRGLDTSESVGIGGAIVRNGIEAKTVLYLAITFLGVATILGVYICNNSSWWLAVIGLICMATGYLYTGGPYPIAYTPFGELISGTFMGLVIILISFFIQTGIVSLLSILISVPTSILIGAILMANNIRDLDRDKEKGRRTLAILLGKPKAIHFLSIMFTSSYLWIVCLVLLKHISPWSLLVFISVPKAVEAIKGFKGKTNIEMMPAMKATAQTNTIFGFSLALGIVFSYCF